MKFQRADSFKADWRRLDEGEQRLFRDAVPAFHAAAEAQVQQDAQRWPGSLRVRAVEGAPGIWEMTWSFAGPDGRATFEWVTIDGEAAVRWRRIGGHAIFRRP